MTEPDMRKLNSLAMLEEFICWWFEKDEDQPPTQLAYFANKTVTRIRITRGSIQFKGYGVREVTHSISNLFPNVRTITIDTKITEDVRSTDPN